MNYVSVKFYIGLRDSNGAPVPESAERAALDLLSNAYPDGLTIFRAEGRWQGKPEPSMVVETIVDDSEDKAELWARSIARPIALDLGQSAVVVTVSRVRFTLVGSGSNS